MHAITLPPAFFASNASSIGNSAKAMSVAHLRLRAKRSNWLRTSRERGSSLELKTAHLLAAKPHYNHPVKMRNRTTRHIMVITSGPAQKGVANGGLHEACNAG